MDLQTVAEAQPPFGRLIGMKIIEAQPDRVVTEMVVREELANRNGVLHGGAVMALADKANIFVAGVRDGGPAS